MLWNIMIVHLLGLMSPGPDFFYVSKPLPVIRAVMHFVQSSALRWGSVLGNFCFVRISHSVCYQPVMARHCGLVGRKLPCLYRL